MPDTMCVIERVELRKLSDKENLMPDAFVRSFNERLCTFYLDNLAEEEALAVSIIPCFYGFLIKKRLF